MPNWYYDKRELARNPSVLEGLSPETEARYRKEGARFIIDLGTSMGLGYSTTATGVVYYHRFYMIHSFRTFPRYVTACCCLFLAGKVEETPKLCKDIIRQAEVLLSESKFQTFGDDPKEEVKTLERILLKSIKFDLQVEHPYGYLFKYAKCLKGDKNKLGKMVQMAWNFVNDSLITTLALQWEPEIIAVALMFLASKLRKFEVVDWKGKTPKHKAWWDMFVEDITTELLEDICHQVLDLYSTQPTPSGIDSPPLPPQLISQPALKAEKKSSTTPPQSISPTNHTATIKTVSAPMKNGAERMDVTADILHGQPIKSIVDVRFQYPTNFGPPPPPAYPAVFPPALPPVATAPPSLLSVPRPPLGFTEPPPTHFPPAVSINTHPYFPPPQPGYYHAPP